MLDDILDEERHNTAACPAYSVWFEDALRCYGVPTVVFDLHVLVPDIQRAAEVLSRQHGWTSPPPVLSNDVYSFLNSVPELPRRRLVPQGWHEWPKDDHSWPQKPGGQPPPPKPAVVVLLPAARWNMPEEVLAGESHGPPLPILLDRLIGDLLGSPDGTTYHRHISCHVGYIYRYVPEVKQTSFRRELSYTLQQFHLDQLAGLPTGTRTRADMIE